jgi:hypothetical protein
MRWFALLSLLLAACGGSGSGSNTSNGGFSIEVDSAEWHNHLGAATPPSGRTYAVLKISIANKSESRAVSANGALFSVSTKAALSVPISGALGAVASPCADLSVQKGGQLSCGLAFEVPSADTPVTLVYDDGRGFKASSSVPTPVHVCEAASWGSSCTSCVQQNLFVCVTNASTCTPTELNCFVSAIQSAASQLCTAPTQCTASSACSAALAAQADCLISWCAPRCGG